MNIKRLSVDSETYAIIIYFFEYKLFHFDICWMKLVPLDAAYHRYHFSICLIARLKGEKFKN